MPLYGSDSVGDDKYLKTINNLAKKIWKPYPEIADICVEDAKYFKNVTLEKALKEHYENIGQPQEHCWYDSRL